MKRRHGGLRDLEARIIEGDTMALRALVRQAIGPNTLEMPFREVELKSKANGTGGERLLFTGYASTVDDPYTMQDWAGDYEEVVQGGAFAKTLAENPDVIFCLNHDWDSAPMARTKAGTLRLSVDSIGLLTEADLDAARADVYQVKSAMDAGELDAMSFAFWVTRQKWSPDYMQRDILEVDLDGGDTSVVNWPANPGTTGTTNLANRQALALARSNVPGLVCARAQHEKREGKALSAATMETLKACLDLMSRADTALGECVPLLTELMGVEAAAEEGPADGDSLSATAKGMSLERLRMLEDPALRTA